MQLRKCPECKSGFTPNSSHHMFCSTTCCYRYNKSRTWEGYFKRLLYNNAKARSAISIEDLVDLHAKQEGLCALSGVELTKIAGKGSVATNASLDRIEPAGPYTMDNVRLLCKFVNGFRSNQSDDELVWWASKIVENKQSG